MGDFLLYISPIGYHLFSIPSTIDIASSATAKTLSNFNLFSKICNSESSFFISEDQSSDDLIKLEESIIPSSLKHFINQTVTQKDVLHTTNPKLQKSLKTLYPDTLCIKNNELSNLFYRYIKLHFITYLPSEQRTHYQSRKKHLAHLIFRKALSFDIKRSDESLVQTYTLFKQTEKSIFKYLNTLTNFLKSNKKISLSTKIDFSTKKISPKKIKRKLKRVKGVLNSEEENTQIKWLVNKIKNNLKIFKILKKSFGQKAKIICPNLNNLVGAAMSSELILRAGSLVKLAQDTSNVIQFYGAEKELFKALKKRKNTPKFGVLGVVAKKSEGKMKGRIVRAFSVKCSLAAKVDAYKREQNGGEYGKKLKKEIYEKFKINN